MSIRTTVTLDEDVLERTKECSRARGIPFRQALNELVRVGLAADKAAEKAPRRRFPIKPISLGLIPGLNYNCTEELLEYGEGPLHR
jgi:hypothetical protein